MTSAASRCSYLPPEAQAAIETATERHASDGDLQAMRDRMGCKAEATHELHDENDWNDVRLSCVEHVGRLLWGSYGVVRPAWFPVEAYVTVTIETTTIGIARSGFVPFTPGNLDGGPR